MKRALSILLSFVMVAAAAARPLSEREACVLATRFYYVKKLGHKIQKTKYRPRQRQQLNGYKAQSGNQG